MIPRTLLFRVGLLFALLAPLLGGCAQFDRWTRSVGLKPIENDKARPVVVESPAPATASAAPLVAISEVEGILAYFNRFQELPVAEQKREYGQLKAEFEQSGDSYDRLRLVCMSLLPGKPFSNREYATKLLQGALRGSAADDDGFKGLAILLTLMVGQHQDLQQALAAEKERAETLARQLKELKDIEKILSDREKQRTPGK
ncbi:hypothetical protein DESUT3_29350 [Desulfuromonas versatilis]|uniref:Lipoprotein n=1 Tax=Desulfuromonas versatilis TaxID=2802975 RepID=A0ABM8HV53_9BACT|nr:hypothetical protein [Desulfuromonas versatilis]BCR05866.1 hypothetical protein DESUT3_29350 [Desulfuromonas versatilis]